METSASNSSGSAGSDRPAKKAKIACDDGATTAKTTTTTTCASLPTPVWARSFNFLPYSDVRSARLVCKVFVSEVPSYIEVLNVYSPAEMDVPSARRYPNVNTLNVFCLFQEGDEGQTTALNTEGVENTLGFLPAFPRLKRAFLGGFTYDEDQGRYSHGLYRLLGPGTPENHKEVFRNFLHALAGAFRTRAMPSNIELQCIGGYYYMCKGMGRDCPTCKKILTHFPLRFCFDHNFRCMPEAERLNIVSGRRDKSRCLTPEFLFHTMLRGKSPFTYFYLNEGIFDDRLLCSDRVIQEMQKKCPTISRGTLEESPVRVMYYTIETLRRIKDLISLGCNPRKVDMCCAITEIVRRYWSPRDNCPLLLFGKMNLVALSKLGFDVSSVNHQDIFIVDEEHASESFENRVGEYYDVRRLLI